MRTDAGEHLNESLCVSLGTLAFLVYRVNKDHHLRDSGIERQLFKVLGYLLHALMVYLLKCAHLAVNYIFGLGKE